MGSRFWDTITWIGYLELKKAVRIITNSTYYAQSEPLFKMLDILLKIQEIYTLQQFKFI